MVLTTQINLHDMVAWGPRLVARGWIVLIEEASLMVTAYSTDYLQSDLIKSSTRTSHITSGLTVNRP